MIPAIRAVPNTSPLGTDCWAIARSVAGRSEINPSATASRLVTGLCDTSTIRAEPVSSRWVNFDFDIWAHSPGTNAAWQWGVFSVQFSVFSKDEDGGFSHLS